MTASHTLCTVSHRALRVCTLLAALGATWAFAQTPPAKPAPAKPAPAKATPATPAKTAPAAKPAAPAAGDSRTLTGKDAASSKLLTRDELRACMTQRDALAARLAELDTARGKLDAERAALGQEQQALKTERESMAGMRAEIDGMNAKTKAFQEDVDGWNKRVATFNESKQTGAPAEKQRVELNEFGESLKKRQAALQTERETILGRGDSAIKGFNARAAGLDQKVAEWNERNGKLNDEVDKTKTERAAWSTECGERRYREDDEKAILSGK